MAKKTDATHHRKYIIRKRFQYKIYRRISWTSNNSTLPCYGAINHEKIYGACLSYYWAAFFVLIDCFGVFDLFEKKYYFPIKAHSRKTSTTLLFCLGSSHINRSIDSNVCSNGIPKAFCRTSLKWHSRY